MSGDRMTMEATLRLNATPYRSELKAASRDTTTFGSTIESTSRKVTDHGTRSGRAAGQSKQLGHELGTVGQRATSASKGIDVLGRSQKYASDTGSQFLKTMGGFVGAQAVVTGLVLAWSQLVGGTIEFDRNMRNVQSITHQSDASLMKMEGTIIGLSKTVPQSVEDLSAGLYDIASSGFAGAAGVEVLRQSAESASAGLTTTATAAKGLTAVLNAYGLSAASAGDVADVLFQTVNVGVLTFEELSQNLGDFVGTASQMGIPIKDAAAALATMTLSGISAAESSTALNRVMQSLLAPSDALAAVFRSWGFETGAAAVHALGLHGVMEKLRVSTGGQADSMQVLLPDIRAMKGALALTAAEGHNYARAQHELDIATEGVGAKTEALREQQKSLGYQLRITWNDVRAGALALGASVAPALARGLGSVRTFLSDTASAARSFFVELGPGFEDIVAALDHVVDAGAAVWEVFRPLVELAASAGLTALVVTFRAIASAVEAVTGFLADNRVIVQTLAVLYAASLVPALGRAAVAFVSLAADKAAMGLYSAAGGLDKVLGAINPVTAALTLAAAAWFTYSKAVDDANRHGDEAIAKSLKGLDPSRSVADSVAAGQRVQQIADQAKRNLRPSRGAGGSVAQLAQDFNPFVDNEIEDQVQQYARANKKLDELSRERVAIVKTAQVALHGLGRDRGIDLSKLLGASDTRNLGESTLRMIQTKAREVDAIVKVAAKEGYDLTKTGAAGKREAEAFVKSRIEVGKAAGYSAEQVKGMSAAEIAALSDEQTAAAEYAKSVGDSFQKAGDLVGHLGGKPDVSRSDITTFYKDTLKNTTQFLDDIKTAYAKGYDPQLVSRLLVAGPEQAGPLLHQLAGDVGQSFVETVNAAEDGLQQLSARAVEIARLQQRALKAATDETAAELPQAIEISRVKMEQGAMASTESIAAALHLTPQQVTSIAASYGITIPGPTVNVSIDTTPVDVPLNELAEKIRATGALSIDTPVDINDPKDARRWWAELKAKIKDVPELSETVARITDPQQAYLWWLGLKGKIESVPENRSTHVAASISGEGDIDRLKTKVMELNGKTFRFSVDASVHEDRSGRGTARRDAVNGAVGFVAYAGGGIEDHRAMIAGVGATQRVWAEPETGGEAYIPLARSKRARSEAILGTVAKRFGYELSAVGPARGSAGWSGHAAAHAPSSSATAGGVTVTVGGTSVVVQGNAATSTLDTLERKLARRDDRQIRKIRAATVGALR